MTNIEIELEQLREQQEQFKNKITELENKITQEEKIDFNKLIGRNNNTLAIKGERYLISYVDGDIFYSNIDNDYFNDAITFKEGKLKDLKYGDIFILKDDLDYIELYNFNIFVGKNKDGNYVVEYLSQDRGVEAIKCNIYFKKEEDKDIIIFNRF